MKRKVLITLLSLALAFCCAFGIVACDNGDKHAHAHSYEWVDNGDGTHKQHCSVAGCDAPDINVESHVWGSDDKCEKCKAVKPDEKPIHSHSWAKAWSNDNTHHWHECNADGCDITNNEQKNGYAEHVFSYGRCVCGKRDPSYVTEGLRYVLNADKESYSVTGIDISGHDIPIAGTDLVIPSLYENKPVTGLGDYAFTGRSFTSVTLPDSLLVITQHAFENCRSLAEINIPNGLTGMDQYAFSGCNSLAEIKYTGDIKGWCSIDGLGNLMSYGKSDKKLFIDGEEVKGNLVIPADVTSIGESAFRYCSGITSVTICDGVTGIGKNAFYNCNKLTGIDIPNSVESIGVSAFQFCDSLTSIEIPNSVESIERYVFECCRNLVSVTIPSSVTSIGESAFQYCSSLTSVTIPNSVTSIAWHAFDYCNGLTIFCEVSEKPRGWNSDWNHSSCPVVWDCDNNDKDKDGYAYAVIDGIRYSLKDGAATVIKQPSNIVTANIPATVKYNDATYNVTSIGGSAFHSCNKLTSITISNGVTSIGGSAFYGCTGLTSITMPNGVTSIGSSAFEGCSNITSITIPNGVTSIGIYMFSDCSALTSIEIPNSVTDIEAVAFSGCSALTSITVADGNAKYHSAGNCIIETESKTLIRGCKSSVIPDDGSVTSIGVSAFNGCDGLTSITIPNGVTSIGGYAFYGCDSLTSIEIPNGVTSIGDGAFRDCSNITSLTIPNSVESIESGAFRNCHSLESVTIPNSVTSIKEEAFAMCSRLIIYCETDQQPNGWEYYWNGDRNNGFCTVVWDCKNNDKDINGYAYATIDGIRYSLKDGEATVIRQYSNMLTVNIPSAVLYKSVKYNVTSIGSGAFYDCDRLVSVTIPSSVTNIGSDAFWDGNGLIIYCEGASKPSSWNSDWNSSCTVIWDCKNNDKDENGFAYAVIDGIRYSLKDGVAIVIRQSNNVTTANIPVTVTYGNETYNVTSIGALAFAYCDLLTKVTIGNSVVSIGEGAFGYCSLLESITFDGTEEQWNAIEKGDYWDYETGDYTIEFEN